jgi:hypothetical protein
MRLKTVECVGAADWIMSESRSSIELRWTVVKI